MVERKAQATLRTGFGDEEVSMGLFGSKPARAVQQFVIVEMTALDVRGTSEHYEGSGMMQLEDQLDEALGDAGGFWENEFRDSQAVSVFVGMDAEHMFTQMEATLLASPLCSHALVTLRRGEVGAPERTLRLNRFEQAVEEQNA